MEIKTFSSALALSLLMASPAVMAMDEGQGEDKGVIVQPMKLQEDTSVQQDQNSTLVQSPQTVTEKKEESPWSVWDYVPSFSWGTKPTPAPAGKEVTHPVTTPPVPSTPIEETSAVTAEPVKTEEVPATSPTVVAPESAEEKVEGPTSAPAAAPQEEIKAEKSKRWFFGLFSSTPATPPAPVSTETVTATATATATPPTQTPLLTQSVMPQEGEDLDTMLEKAKKLQKRLEDKKAEVKN